MIFVCDGLILVLGNRKFAKYLEICKQCNAISYKLSYYDAVGTMVFRNENDVLKACTLLNLIF
jgi:hypothetical protein